jgi:hypothetical protein
MLLRSVPNRPFSADWDGNGTEGAQPVLEAQSLSPSGLDNDRLGA